MKYIKSFESISNFDDVKYNIECLLMDIIDSGFKLDVKRGRLGPRGNIRVKLSVEGKGWQGYEPSKRFKHLVDYLLSLIDYMKTIDYSYTALKVVVGHGYKETPCRIVDGKIRSYPIKDDNRYIAEYLIRGIIIEFNEPFKFPVR